jgi:RNA polymerase sigma factor (sigma-70 family)
MHRLSTARQQQLVLDHLPIAKQLAGRYRGQGVSFDDLEQEAALGLVEAARRFDPSITPVEHFGEYAKSQALKRVIKILESELGHRSAVKLTDLPAPEPDASALSAENELWSAAEILDRDERDLIRDRYGMDGCRKHSIIELASERGISVRALKMRLEDIRSRLRAELLSRGFKAGVRTAARHQLLNLA